MGKINRYIDIAMVFSMVDSVKNLQKAEDLIREQIEVREIEIELLKMKMKEV